MLHGNDRNTLGMVGNGPMQRVMILSKPALHAGFADEMGKEHTGIHEFVHLLDKEDGDVDGLPETLLNRKYTTVGLNWLMKILKRLTKAILISIHMEQRTKQNFLQ